MGDKLDDEGKESTRKYKLSIGRNRIHAEARIYDEAWTFEILFPELQ